jgi:hypothetical protein
MRLLFTLLALAAIAAGTVSSMADDGRIRLAQQGGVTVPIPQPTPTLPTQGLNNCMSSCNTQVGNCQFVCQNAPAGTNPQCYINCTAQQTICQSNCSLAGGAAR